MKYVLTRGIYLVCLMFFYSQSYALGTAYPGYCSFQDDGGYAIGPTSYGACGWTAGSGSYYGSQQKAGFSATGTNPGDDHSYVPVSGNYVLQLYVCTRMSPYYSNMDTCSVKQGRLGNGGGTFYLESTIPIAKQKISNNISTTSIPSGIRSVSACIVIMNKDTYIGYAGERVGGTQYIFPYCPDGVPFSPQPAGCKFNDDLDLDVNLGTLERSEIAVQPGTSVPVTKDINISCTGNIPYNANMKLEFTPISVSNEQVISTSTTGLGVAVLYNGKAIQPGKTFPLSYQPGIHTLTLGFEAVRDPAMAVADLKTGDFTANAVLVFTEQ